MPPRRVGWRAVDIDEGSLIMWYDEPASVWNEALPIGNGRLGAMVFGDPASERLQLEREFLLVRWPVTQRQPERWRRARCLRSASSSSMAGLPAPRR